MTQQVTLGVDIGGTFTDVVLVDGNGKFTTGKYLTTPADPTVGLLRGVTDVLARTATPPSAVTRFAHATTLATNVILERRGVPVAFVTNRGFGSMLQLGRHARVEEARFDLFFDAAVPPIPRSHCFEVPRRILADGRELEPFDDDAARAALAEIAALGVAAVAVCFLHSYVDARHETRMAELARAALPGVTVVASSEVWPELREYERATTTVMSAYVGPVMEGYLLDLRRQLYGIGVAAPIHVMGSSGGVMSATFAARRAVYTIESGPAASVASGVIAGGGSVVVAARRPQTLAAVARAVGAGEDRLTGVTADVARPDDVRALVERTMTAHGRIDVLVNAAFPDAHRRNVLDMEPDDLEDWRRRVEVGGFGTLLACRYVAPHMVARRSGSIVNVTSLSSRQGYAGRSDYGAAKAQAHLLAHSLADELGPHDVRVNCVAPGFVWSEGLQAFYEREAAARGVAWEDVAAGFRQRIPLRREVTSDEVAAAVLFLASDLASGITGATIDVNGGQRFA